MISAEKKMDWARADFALLTCILLLIILGAATIYSASSYRMEMKYGNSEYYFTKQLMRAVVGLLLMFFIAKRDYRKWLADRWIFYGVSLILLAVLLARIPGITPRNGAYSWINLHFFMFQNRLFQKSQQLR